MISCTQERDFDIPKNLGTEENEMLNDLIEQLDSGESGSAPGVSARCGAVGAPEDV